MSKKRRPAPRGAPPRAWHTEPKRPLRPNPVAPTESGLQQAPALRPGAPERTQGTVAHAYDLGLLDRARRLWRNGAWADLQAINAAEIEHHPQRARLALTVATGHHAAGDTVATHSFAQMALRWGCDRDLVARALIAGVHNSLGRAVMADGRQPARALRHFELAVSPGAPGGSGQLALHNRITAEMGQMGLADELPALRAVAATGGRTQTLASPLRDLREQMRNQRDELSAALKLQQTELANAAKALERTIKSEVLNATKQIEAFANLQGYLAGGKVVPAMHGWPVSPDFALLVVQMIDEGDYDLIIEFGSGSSTLLMAQALARARSRRATSRPMPVQMAFEHQERYHVETGQLLVRAGLRDAVELVLAPLAPYRAADGTEFQYYDCAPALEASADTLLVRDQIRILSVVDGPPGATGPLARYPALPHLLRYFPSARMDLILDDYLRTDEQQVAARWRDELKTQNRAHDFKTFSMEKGACLFLI